MYHQHQSFLAKLLGQHLQLLQVYAPSRSLRYRIAKWQFLFLFLGEQQNVELQLWQACENKIVISLHLRYTKKKLNNDNVSWFNVNDNLPQKLCSGRSKLQNSGSNGLSFHQRRRMNKFIFLQITTCYPHWHCCLPGRNDNSNSRVTTSSHRTSPSINHEADQKSVASN